MTTHPAAYPVQHGRKRWYSITLASLISMGCLAQVAAFERTEERQPCAEYTDTKRPMFGDLHVHTSYSFDSYVSSQRNDPAAAYRYAKGEAITLPDADANQVVRAQIQRPLDFTAVTDHSEFLGPIELCTWDAGTLAYWFTACIATRSAFYPIQLLAADYWANIGVVEICSGRASRQTTRTTSLPACPTTPTSGKPGICV